MSTSNKSVTEGLHDIEEYDKKSVMLFGKDISEIPCFKSTFIYAILGGVGCGLITFLTTSRVRLSTDVSVYAFFGIGMTYWFGCGINHSVKKAETRRKLKDWDLVGGPIDESKWEQYTKKAS